MKMPKCPDCKVIAIRSIKVIQNHLIQKYTCPECDKVIQRDDFGEMP